jgi:hypothetical protein
LFLKNRGRQTPNVLKEPTKARTGASVLEEDFGARLSNGGVIAVYGRRLKEPIPDGWYFSKRHAGKQ